MAFFSTDPVSTLKKIKSAAGLANMGLQNPYLGAVLGPIGVGLNAASGNYPQAALSAVQSGAYLADKAGLIGAGAAGGVTGGAAGSAGALAALGPTLTATIATAPIAVGLLASGIDDMVTSAGRKQTFENRKRRMDTSISNLSDLRDSAGDITDPASFKAWLDKPLWEDERTGDVLANLVNQNLAGKWLVPGDEFGNDLRHLSWAPNETFKPLMAGLNEMGYGTTDGRDPTNFFGYAGGFDKERDRFGIPSFVDVNKSADTWDATLEGLSEMFTKINPAWLEADVDMLSPQEAYQKIDFSLDPQSPRNIAKLAQQPGGAPQAWRGYIPGAAQELFGLTPEDIERLNQQYDTDALNALAVFSQNGA